MTRGYPLVCFQQAESIVSLSKPGIATHFPAAPVMRAGTRAISQQPDGAAILHPVTLMLDRSVRTDRCAGLSCNQLRCCRAAFQQPGGVAAGVILRFKFV